MPVRSATAVVLVLPPEERYLPTLRLALAGVGALAELAVDDVDDMKVAVTEACTNVLRHAFGDDLPASQRKITVRMTPTRGELVVEVEDEGEGFDPAQLQRAERTGLEGEGGLGFTLMSKLADSLHIESAPGSGTKITLMKRAAR